MIPTIELESGGSPPESASAARDSFGNKFREAKIEHFRLSALRHENIRGFDVAVNDSFGVRRIQSFRYLDPKLQYFFERKRLPVDVTAQSFAVDELHGDERTAVLLADVVDRANARDGLERMRRAPRAGTARAPAVVVPVFQGGVSELTRVQAGYREPCIRRPSRRRRVAPGCDSAKWSDQSLAGKISGERQFRLQRWIVGTGFAERFSSFRLLAVWAIQSDSELSSLPRSYSQMREALARA